MTTYRISDAQLEAVLRAHVPAAPSDLRARISAAAATTPQRRRPPVWLSPVADPARPPLDRRVLLIAAMLVLAAATVGLAILGQRLLQPPSPERLLERTWAAMADPPPFEMDLEAEDGRPYRLLSDGEGRIRFSTTDEDDPAFSDWALVAEPGRRGREDRSMQLWLNEARPDEPALAEVWTSDLVDGWRSGAVSRSWPPTPDCEWAEPEPVTIAGRPASRLLCPGLTLTVDEATGLPVAGSWVDLEGRRTTLSATAVRFVTPPAEAFVFGSERPGTMDLTDPPSAEGSLDPVDPAGLVGDALAALEAMPPFTMLVNDSQGSKVRWSHDGAGTIRMDHFANRADDVPSEAWIASAGWMTRLEHDGAEGRIAVEYADQGDPRLELVYGLGQRCAEWTYVGASIVADRPAHHLEGCDVRMWLDVETLLVLRSEGHARMVTDADPDRLDQRVVAEVVELDLTPPPAERFDRARLTAGLETISAETYQCRMDPAACPDPDAPSEPPFVVLPTPPAAEAPAGVTTDPAAVVAKAERRHAALPALVMTVREQHYGTSPGGNDVQRVIFVEGSGRWRDEYDWDLVDPTNPPTVFIVQEDASYEQWIEPTGTFWRRYDREDPLPPMQFSYGIELGCLDAWQHAGFATVAGRVAHHLACEPLQYWVDIETGMVLRFERTGTFAQPEASIHEVVDLEEGPQDPALFELPPGAVVH